ncbi:MAG: Type 1 glutamine amidotransferase-like domain-containing protein, partial [Cyanobacteria bacterium REEB65]|nr:Type 1 glutamine amidotransferase-like domain-containing protein [Cyanobacteria bacterium REEB65]
MSMKQGLRRHLRPVALGGLVLTCALVSALPGWSALGPLPSPLVLSGGGQVGPEIFARALSLAGGKTARVVIVPAAAGDPAAAVSAYQRLFSAFGVTSTAVGLPPRAEAFDPQAIRTVGAADLLYFTGGQTRRLVDAISGTPLLGAIVDAWQRGAVVAGSGAGALPWGSTYLGSGTGLAALQSGLATGQDAPGLALHQGLSMVGDLLVDTRFDEDAGLGRLLLALAASPSATAIGLDAESTAILQGREVQAAGAGAVTILEAPQLVGDNALEANKANLFSAGPFQMERLTASQSYLLGSLPTPATVPTLPRAPSPTPQGGFFGFLAPAAPTPVPTPQPTPAPLAGPLQPVTLLGARYPSPLPPALPSFVRDS